MNWFRDIGRRLWVLFHRAQVAADLNEEMRLHRVLREQDQLECGQSAAGAHRIVRIRFGNDLVLREQSSAAWGWAWLEHLGQDARYGVRMLAKRPGFTAVAVITLSLGIGGNAAIFSLVNAILLRPLPYQEPDRVVKITGYYPKGAIAALQERSRTLEIASFSDKPENGSDFNLTGQGEASRVTGSAVSANLFSLLGVPARLGRTFVPGEDRAGRDRLVLLSYLLWQRKFAGEPGIVGRMIRINGLDRRVVGVMPPNFTFPVPGAQLWVPFHYDPSDPKDTWERDFTPLVGRLRPGANVEQARSEMRTLIAEIVSMFPYPMAHSWNADVTALPLQQEVVGNVRTKLLVVLGAVGLVLLMACVNVANLSLSLAATRRKEIALRSALGAARGRIVRQLLTESVLLALAGGSVGLALAVSALTGLKRLLSADTPRLEEVRLDWRVLAFVIGLSLITGLACGVAPALRASKLNLAEAVKAGGRRSSDAASIGLRSTLIVGEVALAVVLVVAAGLLIRTLWRLMQVNPGFEDEHLLAVRVTPDESSCQERTRCIALYNELVRRGREMTGTVDVAAANTIPLSGEIPYVVADIEGQPVRPGESLSPLLWAGAITPDYFHVMGIPLLAGREFAAADGENSAPVVIVTAATAKRFWPGENPIGKHLRMVWEKDWRTVVGVVRDIRQFNLADRPLGWLQGGIYMPYPQSTDSNHKLPTAMYLIVRTAAGSSELGREVRGLVSEVNPSVPVGEVRTLDQIVTDSASPARSLMWLFVTFGATALGLAAIGTYGVVSYSVSQRTFELGMRMALGASRGSIFSMVLGQGVKLVLAGLALGVPAALALTRVISAFLYGVTATDPSTLFMVAGLLLAIAALASYVPARFAANVDPMVALRCE